MKFSKNIRYSIAFSIIILIFTSNCSGQSDFDSKLQIISDSIAAKINLKGKKKIAVWDFTDSEDQPTSLGKYIAEELSVYLTNSAKSFMMMDRNHLSTIMKEHKLNAEGFIDANTAKELGKLNAVDAIVTGEVTVFGKKIKLTIKVIETETALIMAAERGDLPINDEVASFMGVPGMQSGGDLGFNNKPLNSNEEYNNPETVNKECEKNNTGDYCFKNISNQKIEVAIDGGYKILSLNPGEKQCINNCAVRSYKYRYYENTPTQMVTYSSQVRQAIGGTGEIYIEKCKSKTLLLK